MRYYEIILAFKYLVAILVLIATEVLLGYIMFYGETVGTRTGGTPKDSPHPNNSIHLERI